jgi:L-ascorbate metabolism protein UlaG (beta-lactamase superfamily)
MQTVSSSIAVRFLGHSTVAVEIDGVTLLTDPVLRPRIAHLKHHHSHLAETVPAPDAVLISHLHQDHLDFPSLYQLGTDVRIIAPIGSHKLLRRHGFRNIAVLEPNETVSVGTVEVRATVAEHSGFRPPFGPHAACLGFLIGARERIYFAGDTDLFGGMRDLAPMRLALLPVWGWGPTLGKGHLNPETAARALNLLKPEMAIPIHWGSLFPIGLGRWRQRFLTVPPRDFASAAARIAPDVTVRILAPGEWLQLAPTSSR